MNIIRSWFARHFSDPQVVALALILLSGLVLLMLFGTLLTPVLASVVVAYLLDGPVCRLERLRVPRWVAAALLSTALLLSVVWVSFALLPLLTRQAGQIVQELPALIDRIQTWIASLPSRYPALITGEQIDALLNTTTIDVASWRQSLVTRSLVVGMGLLYLGVYILLVPLMVFFMLRDKHLILTWVAGFVPRNRGLVQSVWTDVNAQLSNYVRGKAVEIAIVWVAAYATFTLLGLKYAMLLSALVGFSVLVPYIGAFGMTVPVMLVAYAQWGMEAQTLYVLVAYIVLQMIDGNILVPVLFSEAVDLHPVAIITAVLFFGGVWGFWGVFFAIPLATVVHAVIKAWPRTHAPLEGDTRGLGAG
ncbi:permase [Salinisphaera orenii MK-B5]|uniref:Permase n=1 Tax=Salinisphaera orenii MK-B5 TaxID=856730 RepID=A0A423PRQ9_9GAMM|nr:AI-2E family transporter [Salinisphaera orenii]ROO28299.1 permase [Salinisphaera orenii MK-B5]